MGLDCSHGAFHGAYSAFYRFRQAVCKVIGGSFPPHEDPSLDPEMFYCPDGGVISDHPGLYIFLTHSDCDGEISPKDCVKVADELEELLPELEKLGKGAGHIAHQGGYRAVAEKFIRGCRKAAEAGEPLLFH